MAEAAGVAYLRTFPDFEQGNVSASEALGLDRVLALLEEVGSPHLRLPVAHIAGTKGKGSTSACLASIAGAAGYRTGLFTQPHLLRVNERFAVDGEWLTDDTLTEILLGKIRPAIERLAGRGITGIQQFEAQVALAMLWFESLRVDLVVLEVGLGGRLDGTNVVPHPLGDRFDEHRLRPHRHPWRYPSSHRRRKSGNHQGRRACRRFSAASRAW